MKRISALFTTVAVILSLFSSAAATKESKGITGVEFAQLFIDNCYNDVNDLTTNETIQSRLIVGESINIYNENDELIGFCMDLQRDQQPSGYIVVKFTDKGPMIEEFVTEIGALNLYNNIVEKSKLAVQTADKKLYGFGPMEYYVPVQEQGETIYTDYATQKYTQTEFNIIKQNYGKQAARLKNRTLDDWIDEYNQKMRNETKRL